jgi:hypothetical protein
MLLDERFMVAVLKSQESHPAGVELLPMLLAQACVDVLSVTGAGLSMTYQLRVPLGSSDPMAARAEALQASLGEGPCLAATAAADPLIAGEAEMATRWPMFYRELSTQTAYRGVASFPLHDTQRRRFGALDLYATDPADLHRLSMDEVSVDVADPIAGILFDGPYTTSDGATELPVWMENQSVTRRMNVWVAVGMLIEHSSVTNDDALSVLRGYGYSHDLTLDTVADQVISRQVRPSELLS